MSRRLIKFNDAKIRKNTVFTKFEEKNNNSFPLTFTPRVKLFNCICRKFFHVAPTSRKKSSQISLVNEGV